jgi:hypothetical protein
MVLLDGIGKPVLDAPADDLLEQAYQAVDPSQVAPSQVTP